MSLKKGTKDVSLLTKIPPKLGTKDITINGIYKASDENLDGYSEVNVKTSGVDINNYFYNEFPTELVTGPKALMIIKQIPRVFFNGQSASYLFNGFRALKKLDTSGIDTSNCTNMDLMFGGLFSLKELEVNHFDTSKVTHMYNTFGGLKSAEVLDLSNWNTDNVTNMSYMFNSCFKIITLNLSNFNMSKVTNISSMFYDSSFKGMALQNIIIGNHQLGKAYLSSQSENYSSYTLDVKSLPLLTHESLMNIINGLYDIKTAGVASQQLIIGSTNIAKLTSEEIAIATNKGWTVS